MENSEFKESLFKKSFDFAKDIIALSENFGKKQSNNIIFSQLIRSATSVGANIIEAQSGSSRKDFTNFLSHSLKSANESKFWLMLLKETNPGKEGKVDELIKQIEELSKILGSSVRTLRENK